MEAAEAVDASREGSGSAPLKVVCALCKKFLFSTYTNPVKIEVRCRACKANIVVTVDGKNMNHEVL